MCGRSGPAGRRKHRAGAPIVALAALILIGCGDESAVSSATPPAGPPPAVTSTTADAVSSTSSTTDQPTSPAPRSAELTWAETALPLSGDMRAVALSPDALVVETANDELYAYLLVSKRVVKLPTRERIQSFDIDGPLVVWTEYGVPTDDRLPYPSTLHAYRLPDGPVVNVAGDPRVPWSPRVDSGRIFFGETRHVSGDLYQGEESLDSFPLYMVAVDATGAPQAEPILVSDRPNSSHGPGGDELWSYDVRGRYLAFQRDWGEEPGVYLLDRETGAETYLGQGAIPSVSDTLVAWRGPVGETGWTVEAYNLASGRVATLASAGHMPFAGPGYMLYARSRDGQSADGGPDNDLLLLAETTGSETVVGRAGQSGGYPYISMAGTEGYVAWVSRESTDDRGELHVLTGTGSSGRPAGAGRDIWAGSTEPPLR